MRLMEKKIFYLCIIFFTFVCLLAFPWNMGVFTCFCKTPPAYARVGEKKCIYQVEALPEELQLVVVIQGASPPFLALVSPFPPIVFAFVAFE